MTDGRTLLLAVDGLDEQDVAWFRQEGLLPGSMTALRIASGGPSEPAPALASLSTGASVARTGIASQTPFPDVPTDLSEGRRTWYARSLTAPTLFDAARERGLVTAALQWPATAGAGIDLCLPLVEDLRHYRTRWDMAERTSSPRMVTEHLIPRREAGVQLSQVPPDALVAEIAAEALLSAPVQLLAARLTGLGTVRQESGLGSAGAVRALLDTAEDLRQVLTAFAAGAEDRVVLVPGRRLVPTALLVHPNATLAEAGLLRTDGARLSDVRALVWPDGPRGVLHVRREEGLAVRAAALEALTGISAHARLRLRVVDDGVGATAQTDVIAVLEGTAGTVVGFSPTHRALVDGDDPYCAGPRAVTDPSAPTTALAQGPGLPEDPVEGSWADLGLTIAHALGLELPGATAHGMHRRRGVQGREGRRPVSDSSTASHARRTGLLGGSAR